MVCSHLVRVINLSVCVRGDVLVIKCVMALFEKYGTPRYDFKYFVKTALALSSDALEHEVIQRARP